MIRLCHKKKERRNQRVKGTGEEIEERKYICAR
jgi:hypothetical protein